MTISTILWITAGLGLYGICALGVYAQSQREGVVKYPLSKYPLLASFVKTAMSAAWPVTMVIAFTWLGLAELFPTEKKD